MTVKRKQVVHSDKNMKLITVNNYIICGINFSTDSFCSQIPDSFYAQNLQENGVSETSQMFSFFLQAFKKCNCSVHRHLLFLFGESRISVNTAPQLEIAKVMAFQWTSQILWSVSAEWSARYLQPLSVHWVVLGSHWGEDQWSLRSYEC